MQPPDGLAPLVFLVVGVVGLVVDNEDGAAPRQDARHKVFDGLWLRRRFGAEHLRHNVRLVVGGRVGALVELLDVGEVQRALGTGAFGVPAHVTFHIPIEAEFRRDDGIDAEDAPAREVALEALEDDDVGGDQEAGPGIVGVVLHHSVEVLPDHGQRCHFGLAAAGRHFEAVTGVVVVLEEAQLSAHGLGVGFDEGFVAARLGHFVEEDECFHGLALEGVVAEFEAVGQAVVGAEPVGEQGLGGGRRAFVVAIAPILHGLTDGRDARRGFEGDL